MAELTEVDSYEFHRQRCRSAAEAWELAAETARLLGKLTVAHDCNEQAIRMRYIAEQDDALRPLFNAADRLLSAERSIPHHLGVDVWHPDPKGGGWGHNFAGVSACEDCQRAVPRD